MESPTKQRPYRVCESCGRLTPTSSPWCVECGVASRAALEMEIERQDEKRFAVAFFSRNVWMTWLFLAANLVVFGLMTAYTGGAFYPDSNAYTDALVRFGAEVKLYVDLGEYWRLVTATFIHVGIIHLFVNMYSLWIIGPRVERLYGASRFVVLYVLSGVGGTLGSYFFGASPLTAGAGASGALFGLVGVLLVFGLRFRSELPGVFRQAFSVGPIIFTILLNLYIGFAIPFIDNAAHIGGLVAGALLAMLIPYARRERRAPIWWIAAAVLCISLVGVSFTFAAVSPPRRHPISEFIDDYNATDQAVSRGIELVKAAAAGRLGDAELDRAVEALEQAAARARSMVRLDETSATLLERRAKLLDALASAVRRAADGGLAPGEIAALETEAERLEAEWQLWIEREGEGLGIQSQPNPQAPAP